MSGEKRGRSRNGPRCVLASRILLSPTQPRMQGILRLVFSNATAYSVSSRHVVLVSFLSRLVLAPSRVWLAQCRFYLVSVLSRLVLVSSRLCRVTILPRLVFVSFGFVLLVSWTLGRLVSWCLISCFLGLWSLGLLISWSLVSWPLGLWSLVILLSW